MNVLSGYFSLVFILCLIVMTLTLYCRYLKRKLLRYESKRPKVKYIENHSRRYYINLFSKYKDKLNIVDNMSGIDFEGFCAGAIKCMGFNNIYATKATGDFGVDLIADKDGMTYAIQCKCYSKPVGVSAIQEVYSGCRFYDCDAAIVISNRNYTKAANELANSLGVTLYGRKWIVEAINAFMKYYSKGR